MAEHSLSPPAWLCCGSTGFLGRGFGALRGALPPPRPDAGAAQRSALPRPPEVLFLFTRASLVRHVHSLGVFPPFSLLTCGADTENPQLLVHCPDAPRAWGTLGSHMGGRACIASAIPAACPGLPGQQSGVVSQRREAGQGSPATGSRHLVGIVGASPMLACVLFCCRLKAFSQHACWGSSLLALGHPRGSFSVPGDISLCT